MVAASYESSATADTKPNEGGAASGRGAGGVSIAAGGSGAGLTSVGAGTSGAVLTVAGFGLVSARLFEDLDPDDLPDNEFREMFWDDPRLEPDREREKLFDREGFAPSSRTEKFVRPANS